MTVRSMGIRSVSVFVLLVATAAWVSNAPQAPPPKLVVVVTVDQMRAEMLERFAPHFSGGFARLLRGAIFTDGHHDHAATVTATGHATIGTGVFPSKHGIVGNEYYDRIAQQPMYCAGDSTASILGYEGAPGRSPRNLLRPTLGDWLKSASPESKVYGLAIKDRSAILTAGLHADGAYWYHYPVGRFVTSSFYADSYPEWVQAFNESGLVDQYHGREWHKLLSDESYVASREDSFPAEADGEHTTFPHVAGQDSESPDRDFYNELPYTPFGDEVTLTFARELVTNEALGTDDVPDILFLGLSSADFIGHRFGPYSQEVQDHFVHVDRALEEFFAFLDEHVGPDQYVVALSADHGVLAMPEELTRRGVDAGRLDSRTIFGGLRESVVAAMEDSLIIATPRLRYMNGIVISFADSAPEADALTELRERVARGLEANEMIVNAFTLEALAAADVEAAEPVGRFRRSFHPDRSADVAVHLRENYMLGSRGATHGSAHDYDTHVPIVFMGPGIAAGSFNDRVRTVDMAPTLASLLGLAPPADLDGRVLSSALTGQ
jgi:predicted AlkP superfamily pyrophosphatase or phosphodiesterase